MASCAQHERAARAASPSGSFATRLCRATRRAREHVSHVGQWDAPGAGGNTAAARAAVEHLAQRTELLPLVQLAREFHVHVRTLQAAVRTGRLAAHFSVKSVFGRPRRLATRAATEQFMATHYRRFGGQKACLAPLPTVPNDYDQQLRGLRRRLRLTQDGLARRIGAAGKAVIYQWESRKRTPSPVLWQQVMRLQLVGTDMAVSTLGERRASVAARAGGSRQERLGQMASRCLYY
jgi:DNA-binding XRE family transcriptional regulator